MPVISNDFEYGKQSVAVGPFGSWGSAENPSSSFQFRSQCPARQKTLRHPTLPAQQIPKVPPPRPRVCDGGMVISCPWRHHYKTPRKPATDATNKPSRPRRAHVAKNEQVAAKREALPCRDASHVLPEAVGARGRRARGGEGVGGAEACRREGRSDVRRAPAAVGGAEAVGLPEERGHGAAAGTGIRVRLGQLRAQLRRRRVEGRGGRVLARALVLRRVQDRCCVVVPSWKFSFLVL